LQVKPDLLLIGNRARGLLQRAFVSSVSSYIVRMHARRACDAFC
jgi:nucleotide-binding universal stress UspA family protein